MMKRMCSTNCNYPAFPPPMLLRLLQWWCFVAAYFTETTQHVVNNLDRGYIPRKQTTLHGEFDWEFHDRK